MTPKQLKASILQLAIQGKLVPQDPNDEPASELLKRIEAAKNAKGAKKGKPLPPIMDDEKPFSIPDSWVWVRLGDVGEWGSGATPLKGKLQYYTDGTIPWLLTGDLNDGLITQIPNRITDIALKETSLKLNPKGSVLIAMYGATIGKVGILDIDSTTNQACCACVTNPSIDRWFLFYFLMAQRDAFRKRGEGGAQPNISKEKIIVTPIPLPPLAEQKRIAAKVEALFKYVDECEDSRKQLAESLSETLKRSVLQEAIQGRLVPQDPNDEPTCELLKNIAAEREKQIAEKKIKKSKPLPPVKDEEKPFPIPDSWEWVRLGELVSAESGLSYKKEDLSISRDEMVRVLRGGNILDGKYVFKGDDVFIAKEFAIKRPSIKAFDFVLPAVTSLEHLGKTAFFEEDRPDVYAGGFLLMLHLLHQDKWIAKYLLAFFQSEQYHSYCKNIANKSGQAFYNLSREKLCLTPIPLPPLAEQKRIVAKVDSLLAKIEEVREAVC